MAAITNYHQPGGLKQHTFIILQYGGQRSEISSTGLKLRCQQSEAPSRDSKGESVSLPFPTSGANSVLRCLPMSSKPAGVHLASVFPLQLVLKSSLPLSRPLVMTFRVHLDIPGSSHQFKTLNFTLSAKSLLPNKVTQFCRLGCDIFGGRGHYSAYNKGTEGTSPTLVIWEG